MGREINLAPSVSFEDVQTACARVTAEDTFKKKGFPRTHRTLMNGLCMASPTID